MNRKPKEILHIARYGIPADQHFLLDKFLPTYDQLVVNATILAHQPTAVAGFIASKANKPFFIDPQTHAFQHNRSYITSSSDRNNGKLKTSVVKLIKKYGELISRVVIDEGRAVRPEDFNSDVTRAAFVEKVLSFQEIVIEEEISRTDAQKYYAFLKKKKKIVVQRRVSPCRIVAPYFYLDKHFGPWLETNIKCLSDAVSIKGKEISAQIVLSKEVLLSEEKVSKIVGAYSEFKGRIDSFLVWVDDFNESEVKVQELKSLVSLLSQLSAIAPAINLYGGYFSVMLGRYGIVPNLIGVSHGLEYGESRAVVPVGGGLPVAKFYFPSLHLRLPARDAYRAVKEYGAFADSKAFHREICSCKECVSVIKNNPEEDFHLYTDSKEITYEVQGRIRVSQFPKPETKRHLINHYMWRKEREYRGGDTFGVVLADLRKAHETLLRTLNYYEQVAHCKNWLDVVSPE